MSKSKLLKNTFTDRLRWGPDGGVRVRVEVQARVGVGEAAHMVKLDPVRCFALLLLLLGHRVPTLRGLVAFALRLHGQLAQWEGWGQGWCEVDSSLSHPDPNASLAMVCASIFSTMR